jgi:HAD superfamily hydrolase (TIGR01509 family)
MDAAHYLCGFAERLGGGLTLEAWTGALRAALTPLRDALELAAALGRRASVAVFTNNNLLVAREIDAIFPELRPIFGRNIFVSAEFRARKPDPEVYRRCLARLGAAPEAALFVDDSSRNVAGAERAGLAGYLCVDADALVDRQKLFQRRARGLRFGHLTIRSGQYSGARSVSLADTRPRTETPASCTLSGEPEINGCQSNRFRPSATSR